jgi:hypothetical protein
MQLLKCSRLEDAPALPIIPQPMSYEGLLGTWVNTNPGTRGIAKLVVSQQDRSLFLRIFGFQSPSLIDWGLTPIEAVYARDVNSGEPMAFEARYDMDFMEVQVQANFSLGLLVLACFNTFKDQSGRENYFSREFFCRESAAKGNGHA